MCTYCYGSRITSHHPDRIRVQRKDMWNTNMTLAEEAIVRLLAMRVHRELMDKRPTSDEELHIVSAWETLCQNMKIDGFEFN